MVYSLVDEGGEVKLGMAKSALGVPVRRGDGGRLVMPWGGIGEVAVKPLDGALEVRFGGETLTCQKLEPADGDQEAFAAAASGRYVSDDADTAAEIAPDGDRLVLSLSDGFGRTRAPLYALSPRVAYSRPRGAMSVWRAVISLDVEGGKASGFQLDTPRTRGLAFRRA